MTECARRDPIDATGRRNDDTTSDRRLTIDWDPRSRLGNGRRVKRRRNDVRVPTERVRVRRTGCETPTDGDGGALRDAHRVGIETALISGGGRVCYPIAGHTTLSRGPASRLKPGCSLHATADTSEPAGFASWRRVGTRRLQAVGLPNPGSWKRSGRGSQRPRAPACDWHARSTAAICRAAASCPVAWAIARALPRLSIAAAICPPRASACAMR